MEKLNFSISIDASPVQVWNTLWDDATYRKWTRVFHDGSHAISEWKEGSRIHFLSPSGDGMFGVIKSCSPCTLMSFKHLGVITKFEEQALDEETKKWSGAIESYHLIQDADHTILKVDFDAVEKHYAYFNEMFPKALLKIKEIAEEIKKRTLMVEVSIPSSIENIWELWTNPDHIKNWYFASEDWWVPEAENDVRLGGKFKTTMAAKDESFRFDFEGDYIHVKYPEKMEFTLSDGRNVKVNFIENGEFIRVIETFEPEKLNPLDLQKSGWQSILENFKKYVLSQD